MTNLLLDYDNYEYNEFQDPTPEDLSKAYAEGFEVVTSKTVNMKHPQQGDMRIVTVLMRRKRA